MNGVDFFGTSAERSLETSPLRLDVSVLLYGENIEGVPLKNFGVAGGDSSRDFIYEDPAMKCSEISCSDSRELTYLLTQ